MTLCYCCSRLCCLENHVLTLSYTMWKRKCRYINPSKVWESLLAWYLDVASAADILNSLSENSKLTFHNFDNHTMQPKNSIRQISLSGAHIQDANQCTEEEYSKDLQQFRKSLLKSCPKWPRDHDKAGSPLPLLIPKELAEQFQTLGELLDRAITNIVERWWTDEQANFSERMPILPRQESLLRVSRCFLHLSD